MEPLCCRIFGSITLSSISGNVNGASQSCVMNGLAQVLIMRIIPYASKIFDPNAAKPQQFCFFLKHQPWQCNHDLSLKVTHVTQDLRVWILLRY